jgi:hypothetical protein
MQCITSRISCRSDEVGRTKYGVQSSRHSGEMSYRQSFLNDFPVYVDIAASAQLSAPIILYYVQF